MHTENNQDVKYLQFYRSFYDAIKELPVKKRYQEFKNLCEYCFNNVILDDKSIVFLMAKPNIDGSIDAFRNGKKGGSVANKQTKLNPPSNTPLYTPSKLNVNVKVKEEVKEEVDVKVKIDNSFLYEKNIYEQYPAEYKNFNLLTPLYLKKTGDNMGAFKVYLKLLNKGVSNKDIQEAIFKYRQLCCQENKEVEFHLSFEKFLISYEQYKLLDGERSYIYV